MNMCCDIGECCECCEIHSYQNKLAFIDQEVTILLTNTWRSAIQFQDGFKEQLKNKLLSLEEDTKLFDDYLMYFLNEHEIEDYELLSKYFSKEFNESTKIN